MSAKPRRGAKFLQRPQRRGQPGDKLLGGVELPVHQREARIGAVQVGRLLAPDLAEFGAQRDERAAQSRVPGLGRGPRNTARSSAAIAAAGLSASAPSRISGCLSSASSGTGASPPSATSTASRANIPAGVSGSASPPESSTGTCQRAERREHAARQRAIGRHQRGGLARVSAASRSATAIASASSSALAASITASAASARSLVRGEFRFGELRLPTVGGGGRAQRFRHSRSRPCAGGVPEHLDLVTRNPDPAQQPLHRKLRMPTAGAVRRRRLAPSIMLHDSSSRSVSSPGSTTAPCGSLAMVAISSAVAGIEPVEPAAITGPSRCRGKPLRLGGDQAVAARRGFDPAALGEHRGPSLARDLEKPQRQLPVWVERVRHEFIEPVPRHLPRHHVVHQPRQIVGERERGGGRVRDQRRAGCGAHVRRGAHLRTSSASSIAPLEPIERVGQRERIGGEFAGRHAGERDLVLVDIADRDDARQDRGVALEQVKEAVAHQPARAPGRQIERRVRESERFMARRKALDQPARRQRVEQRRHERHRCRNGEHSGDAMPESYTTSRPSNAT